MGFLVSPGVNVSEVDLTNVIPTVSSTTGAFVGAFEWGPLEERVLVDSEKTLEARFGEPKSDTAVDFLTASSFLAYGNALFVVRAANSTAINATTSGTGVLVKNRDNYDTLTLTDEWLAKYPGVLGNSLRVVAIDSLASNTAAYEAATYFGTATYSSLFQATPGTSDYVAERGGSNDEIHVAVIDAAGAISGTAGTVLEVFEGLSKASDAKSSSGANNYYKNVINSQSRYLWFGDHHSDGTNWGTAASGIAFASLTESAETNLTGGVSGNSDVPKTAGYDLFLSPTDVDVSLIFAGAGDEVLAQKVIDTAVARKDCMAFVSPRIADVVNAGADSITNVLAFKTLVSRDTSYAVMDSGWKLMYDKYNDTNVWVPLNADIAGLVVRTDATQDAWYSPAGFTRGGILNSIRLAWNPKQAERDLIYKVGINPVVSFPGQGTILYGDKTLQSKPSAFDRINVRRLFIVLQKAISTAAKFLLFEFNDEFTRAQFRNSVEPFLREVQGRRGVTDFSVVCDSTNNTPQVIDTNSFVGDIYVKPNRSINFINLNFVAVRSGVEFSEIVGA